MNKDFKVYLILFGQKIFSGLAGLALLAFLTNNLTSFELGKYFLYTSIIAALANICYQWQGNVIQLYYTENRQVVLYYINKISKILLGIGLITIVISIILLTSKDALNVMLIVFASATTGIFIALIQILNSEHQHSLYSKSLSMKALLILISSCVAWSLTNSINWIIFSSGVSSLLAAIYALKKINFPNEKKDETNHLWNYGKYYFLLSICTSVIDYSDKLLISHIISYGATGEYGATQTILQQTLGAFLSIIYIYHAPKIIQNNNDVDAIKHTKKTQNTILYCGVMLIASVNLLYPIGRNIFFGEVGKNFSSEYILLLQISIFLGCIKGYVIDLRLVLMRDSKFVFLGFSGAALTNIVVGYYMINIYGVYGATISSIIAFSVGMSVGLIRLYYKNALHLNDLSLIIAPIFVFVMVNSINYLIESRFSNASYAMQGVLGISFGIGALVMLVKK